MAEGVAPEACSHTPRERLDEQTGTKGGPRERAGGRGGGGDSAALRPPPRNFAAAGAVATGTESFCSPVSGLPRREDSSEVATPGWNLGRATPLEDE